MLITRIDSKDKNVSKYVFEFEGDNSPAVAEAVLYKYPTFEKRTVVCCSTQSGCPVGCRFCGAGDSFVHSLTSKEIVSQVNYLFTERGIDAKSVEHGQIMFMSMGEPLLNMKNLDPAIRKLHKLYPKFSLLVSTSAPKVDFSHLIKLSKEISAVGLQFSVHESTDIARDKLIPFNKKLNLREIAKTGEKWHKATSRKPFFNYCAHENNSAKEDADRIRDIFDPEIWECTVSVVCERDESIAAANERQRSLATGFMNKMRRRGFSTRCFDPAGQDDIGGGCGQLWYVQDWMNNHQDIARPSIGREFPLVHAPKPLSIK